LVYISSPEKWPAFPTTTSSRFCIHFLIAFPGLIRSYNSHTAGLLTNQRWRQDSRSEVWSVEPCAIQTNASLMKQPDYIRAN